MQVGMVGSDGIVLASDTKETHAPILEKDQLWAGAQFGSNTPKIEVSHERGMAIACAFDMETARQVAKKIMADLKDEELEHPIAAIKEIAASVQTDEQIRAQCIIVLTRPSPRMFMFQYARVEGRWSPYCQEMESKAIAGDNLNAAIFWMERYYDGTLSTAQLTSVAAQLVVSAGRLNPYTISGLEIVLCNSSGIHPLAIKENEKWESRARDLDTHIGDQILGQPPIPL
jgi:hypothetical protein